MPVVRRRARPIDSCCAWTSGTYRFDIRAGDEDRLAWLGWEVSTKADLGPPSSELNDAGVEATRGTADEAKDRGVLSFVLLRRPGRRSAEIFYGQEADFRPLTLTRPMSGYLTGELGMGHAVLGVKDFQANLDFYINVLGFRVSDTFKNFMASCTATRATIRSRSSGPTAGAASRDARDPRDRRRRAGDRHRGEARRPDPGARPPHQRQGRLVLHRDAIALGDRIRLERPAARRGGLDRPPAGRSDRLWGHAIIGENKRPPGRG